MDSYYFTSAHYKTCNFLHLLVLPGEELNQHFTQVQICGLKYKKCCHHNLLVYTGSVQ